MRLVEGQAAATRIPFEIADHLFFWFTQVISRRDRQLNLAMRPYGIRVPEWRALGLLYSLHGLSMSEVAELAAIDPTTLSRSIVQLEHTGLVVRFADADDKRVVRLALTAAGTRLVEQILPVVFRLNEIACSQLPKPVVGVLLWAFEERCGSLDASLAEDAATTALGPNPSRKTGRSLPIGEDVP
jgi:DNA-binding MarR family transcriptional regulator